jgi:beta-galactosidase
MGLNISFKKQFKAQYNHLRNNGMKKNLLLYALPILMAACSVSEPQRKEINLNGTWEITKTDQNGAMPQSFDAEVPVPGLVDMANPLIDDQDTIYENSLYWYRKTFSIDDTDADIFQLKINKAKYHTRIFVNGSFAGENTFSFTPTLLNIKKYLKPGENELIISVGCKNNLPDSVTNGGDFEKTKYIPGIYDDVKLIITGYPYIANVQTAPDVKNQQLRIVAEVLSDGNISTELSYIVRESVSQKIVAKGTVVPSEEKEANLWKADFVVPMDGCNLWSPEDPFLYEAELYTKADNKLTKFGMRTFEASSEEGVFLLNGKPYYLRGTNVCIFRFFEDPNRKGLPWDDEWTVKLHSRFKDMHWNSIRYCIGFPPERWYEIADSLGFLIQDEFPVWTGGKGGFERLLPGVTPSGLAQEYHHWMRERWNHPCVVVWDAQNESVTEITGQAIELVRNFDLSNRPWDNGWAAPVSEHDAIESHPYLFTRYFKNPVGPEGYLKELLSNPRIPDNGPNEWSPSPDGNTYNNPVIINEYGWVWLNRNGTPTTLTETIYPKVFPDIDTPEERLEAYAKILAIKTEYWRAHRNAAGVLHFCGLGYSRPDSPRGQTSDNFTDIQNLTFEPNFYKYVKPAFAPTGIMIDFWEKSTSPDQKITVPVHIMNDTYQKLETAMSLILYRDTEIIDQKSVDFILDGTSKIVLGSSLQIPDISGKLKLVASIVYEDETISSIREFEIKQPLQIK